MMKLAPIPFVVAIIVFGLCLVPTIRNDAFLKLVPVTTGTITDSFDFYFVSAKEDGQIQSECWFNHNGDHRLTVSTGTFTDCLKEIESNKSNLPDELINLVHNVI